ncbi:MAG: DUF3810 domain-containing protein [Oscillospiraceae bacterium]|nr:DUF3810 domain-containing protein [Oscillospiraceae bacterium]
MNSHPRLSRPYIFRRRLTASAVLTAAALALAALSYLPDGLFFRVYTPWSKAVSGGLGFLVSFAPFSVAEFMLYGLILWLIYGLVRSAIRAARSTEGGRHLLDWGVTLLTVLCAALFWFTAAWGLQYRAPPLEERLGLEVGHYTEEQLADTARFLLEQANAAAPLVRRGESGAMEAGFAELARMTVAAVEKLGREDPVFAGGLVTRPKRVTGAVWMDYLYIAGIYSPFTGESNVNPNMAAAFLPETMAHEMAHRLGFAPENDAGFVAFLACIGADDPELRYSAALAAFHQCAGQIEDPALRAGLWAELTPYYRLEVERQAETKEYIVPAIAEITGPIGSAANDSYLKALGQEDGVRSYGRVVDLLIAWRLASAPD